MQRIERGRKRIVCGEAANVGKGIVWVENREIGERKGGK